GALLACAAIATPAQPADLPPLRPLTLASAEAALARLPGAPAPAPATSGALDLRGKQVHIAEFLLLFDLAGEQPGPVRDGKLLGLPVPEGRAQLAWRATPDVAVLQALTDHAWADLQARLQAAGVVLADAAAVVQAHGAVHAASAAGSTAAAPVQLVFTQGGTTRRYLALAPTGMRLVPRTPAGIGPGDAAARTAYQAQRQEALSLAMALHLSVLDTTGTRAPAFAAPGGLPTLSPLMELAPAPAAALVHAHAQQAFINLNEALVTAAPFGRLRLAPLDGPIPSNDPLKPLLSFGLRLQGEAAARRVEALLDLDGPSTARLAVALTEAANQAIANALKSAR
ncbi:hypothetical protein, partial [Pseudaquabacterium pictum]|uniref:hypothetical protein n=1 Tax=Pseudaquabacterium pictum TaxID=2315236 RepID=UPI001D14672D